jgi:dihydrofolate reductase
MRKLILFIGTSLDGYIAGPNGEIDWLFADQDYGYTDFYAGVDTVLMGRKTYDLSLSFGEYPYPGTQAFVFTRTPRAPDAHASFVSQDIGAFVAALKRSTGKHIWLVGGGAIVAECLRHGLIDTFRLFVHPIVLGAGIPLFPLPLPRRALVLQRSREFASGLVELEYTAPPVGG